MSVRNVIDMHEVEAGVDKAGNTAARGLDDDSAGRRRLDVARPNRRRRIDDDGGQAIVGNHGLDQPFRGDLAALVGTDALRFGQRVGFVRRGAIRAQPERGDTAGVNDALHAGPQRRLHHVARAIHIGSEDFARVPRPKAVIGGNMKHNARTFHGPGDQISIAQVALDKLQVEIVEMKAQAAGPHQRPHGKSGAGQSARNRRTDETCGTREQYLFSVAHGGFELAMLLFAVAWVYARP